MDRIYKSVGIAEIIHRYFNGKISEEECLKLKEWLSESDHHREILENYCDADYPATSKQLHQLFEVNQGYEKFIQGKRCIDRHRMIRRITTIAAVFICICCMGGGIFFLDLYYKDSMQIKSETTVIRPGRICATLILDNGRKISLSDSLYQHVAQSSGEINIMGKQLNYQPLDSVDELVWNKVYTPRGGEYSLLLSDGTRVWLNAETELRFPVAFVGGSRVVELKGEAYFEVAKDTMKPFFVKTSEMAIRVLGTSFNVKAYENEAEQTTLITGSVEAIKGKLKQKIVPGDQLILKGDAFKVRQVDVNTFTAWKDQRFVFDDEILDGIIRKLERWYDVQFFIRNASVRELRFTGNLPKYENLDKVLKKLELATHIHFVQKGRTVVVEED